MRVKLIAAAAAAAMLLTCFACSRPTAGGEGESESFSRVEPAVSAQIEYINPSAEATTKRVQGKFIGETEGWPVGRVDEKIPELKADGLKCFEYKSEVGKTLAIRAQELSYGDYLKYLRRLEKAGFNDLNARRNVPEQQPETVAMFFTDINRTTRLGAYYNGSASSASFACEIVIYCE